MAKGNGDSANLLLRPWCFQGEKGGLRLGIFPGGWWARFPFLFFADGMKALLRLHCGERAEKLFWIENGKGWGWFYIQVFIHLKNLFMLGNTDRQDTMDMVAYYQRYHKKKMKDAGLNVADWGWLPIDEVIDYLLELKHKYGCSGIRTYFGAHDKEVSPSDNPYLGYNTAIFVGTTKVGKIHVDLNVLNFDANGNFDLVIGKKNSTVQKLALLDGDDEDKQHLHPPDDDDLINHVSGDRVMHPVSSANAQTTKTNGVENT